jgi:hypothetical protein
VFTSQARNTPEIDLTTPNATIHLQPGESLTPLIAKILDQSLVSLMTIMDDKAERATAYRSLFGEGMGANAPFSMVSFVNQISRQPLIVYQKMLSWAITIAMRMAFRMIKSDGTSLMVPAKTGLQTIEAKDIPDEFDLSGNLEIDLPQDSRLNATVANELVQSGMTSKQYAREKFLQIGQSEDQDRLIWQERFMETKLQAALQAAIMMAQQQAQMQAQGMAQGGQAQGQPQPGGMPPGMPPQEMAGPAAQGLTQAQPGVPMAAPQEAGPMGPGGMPPEGGPMV